MTTILLIRHATCAPAGAAIHGRESGLHLGADGRAQAAELPARLQDVPLAAIYSSPLERAYETAEPLVAARGLELRTLADLTEVDFGDWTGRKQDELAGTPTWRRFNQWRSLTRIPGGELALEAQLRGVRAIERLRRDHPEDSVAAVSHGDLIRAVLLYYLGMPLDNILRVEVAPASISVLEISEEWLTVTGINIRGPLVR